MRQNRPGFRIAHTHAHLRTHGPAAGEHALGNRCVFVLAREEGLDFARAVQADQLEAARIGALDDVGMRRIERGVAKQTNV